MDLSGENVSKIFKEEGWDYTWVHTDAGVAW